MSKLKNIAMHLGMWLIPLCMIAVLILLRIYVAAHGMDQVVVTSLALKLVTGVLGMVLVWWMLRRLDQLSGFDFKQWRGNASSTDLAWYHAFRLLGACVLVGFILS